MRHLTALKSIQQWQPRLSQIPTRETRKGGVLWIAKLGVKRSRMNRTKAIASVRMRDCGSTRTDDSEPFN